MLALGLGIAFRNKPADATRIAVVAGPSAHSVLDLLARAPNPGSIRAEVSEEGTAMKGFHLGKYDLVVQLMSDGAFHYDYDPARPESVLARTVVDDALLTAARDRRLHEGARLALHRLSYSRTSRNEPDEFWHVGHWVRSG